MATDPKPFIPVVKFDIHGLKCDTCDYSDDDVAVEQYHRYINAPCPKCGASLLTQADYDATMELISAAMQINQCANDALDVATLETLSADQGGSTLSIELDGGGLSTMKTVLS